MKLPIPYMVSMVLVLLAASYCDTSAQEKDYHTFTSKKGQTIEATLVTVSPDKTKMRIRRKDGREFNVDIVTFSLEDQMYVKNWLKSNPIKMDFDLEFTFTKDVADTKKNPLQNYNLKFITENTNYNITIRNRTRTTLSGASLEYYIITEHSVHAYPNNNDRAKVDLWFYAIENYNRKRENKQREKVAKPISLKYGKAPIEDLAFSFDADFNTETVPIREITNEGNRTIAKDTILGVIARVIDENGNQLSAQVSPGFKFSSENWVEIAQMPPGDPLGEPVWPEEEDN